MNKSDQDEVYNKGQLSSEFSGATSVGTTIQDEKNIKIDALDGQSNSFFLCQYFSTLKI